MKAKILFPHKSNLGVTRMTYISGSGVDRTVSRELRERHLDDIDGHIYFWPTFYTSLLATILCSLCLDTSFVSSLFYLYLAYTDT